MVDDTIQVLLLLSCVFYVYNRFCFTYNIYVFCLFTPINSCCIFIWLGQSW